MTEAHGVPPSIPGYAYERWLGGGGFADVFLYRQELPERPVAIKVLRENVNDDGARGVFVAEANLMAKVSAHPNIVSIHTAGVSLDQRPYMVMEFYPLDHYGKRLETNRLPHQQVLELGVKIAGAVEVAHRARVVHRDIKPANILAGDYGEPGLTDFGISATQFETHTDESLGFSPPYAPREIIENSHPGDARSDVYSLAATLWTMLAGHSPFERPESRSTKGEIMARVINDAVPPLPAGTAPPSFEAALRHALEKDPDRRPQTARAFGQMLQAIENELGYRETRLVLLEDRSGIESAVADVEAAVERTKQGRGVIVDLSSPAHADPTAQRSPGTASGPRTNPRTSRLEPALVGDHAGAVQSLTTPGTVKRQGNDDVERDVAPAEEADPASTPSTSLLRSRWPIVAAGLSAAGVVTVIAAAALGGGESSRPTAITSPPVVGEVVNPAFVNDLAVDPIAELVGRRNGAVVTFEWRNVDRQGADYIVHRIDGISTERIVVETSPFVIDDVASDVTPCVTVTARVEGIAQSEPSSPVCAAG